MKTHIIIAQDGNLKWLACRTTVNTELDGIDLNDIIACGVPPAVDCQTCLAWIEAEADRRTTKLRKWS